nr:hypothetical protein [Bacillus pumilus]
MKRIPVIFLRYIVFFIPAIIISFMVWNHYQDDLSDGKVTEYDVKRIFTFDEGKRVVSAVSKDQQLHFAMYDPHSGKRISEWTTASDPFNEMWPSIQGNNLLLALKNKDGQTGDREAVSKRRKERARSTKNRDPLIFKNEYISMEWTACVYRRNGRIQRVEKGLKRHSF